jgi:ADP-ribose pyrophosphatase
MTAKSKFEFTAAGWQAVQERVEYKTSIFNLLKRDMIYTEENLKGSFYALDSPDWINVIALTPDEDIVLVEQYRFGIEQVTLELPGGMVDPGEDPLTTAKRELLEETGFCSEHWQSIGKVSSNPAIQTNFTHTYLAKNAYCQQDQDLGEHEVIKVHTLPMAEFLSLAREGVVHHALVLAAIGRYLLVTNSE